MRLQRIIQATLFENFAEHEIGRELRAMSQWLDQHRELLGLVMDDLRCRCRRKPWCAARCSSNIAN
jgi:transposase, IS5 family